MSKHRPVRPLQLNDFELFVQQVYGHPPFRWQSRLAERACAGGWPEFIKLPTSSGKTTCIDIAVFSLAFQASRHAAEGTAITAARRIFFVVDRRVIVNEAFERAQKICKALRESFTTKDPDDPRYIVAAWLQSLTAHETAPPLDCFELRGGIYRDDAWVRSLLQPTIVTSTVDQIGSRLLFRGYGVTDRNLPIHAALTANDSMILLDEAHCSNPFSQTMSAVSRFRDGNLANGEPPKWSERRVATPFHFTQMTATPDESAESPAVFELEPDDYKADELLDKRHGCSKPVKLVECNAKGAQQYEKLAKELIAQATKLASPDSDSELQPCRRIAIVVNRVATARAAFKLLQKQYEHVHLMIGRMRPVDRDELTETLQGLFRSDPNRADDLAEPHFVIATQCLEVGADFDFDGMVTQCASISALRQRFGRLNRLGNSSSYARGVVVMPSGDAKPKNPDPIYGTALPTTWEWLGTLPEDADEPVADFGIRSMDAALAKYKTDSPEDFAALSTEAPDAPVLMPAHLDVLCQTAPKPAIEPDIANFLHGPYRGRAEVRICWRADLPEQAGVRHAEDSDLHTDDAWADACQDVVAVCPPSTAEMLSVPLHQFRNWLNGQDDVDETGDVEGEARPAAGRPEPADRIPANRRGMVWTGQTDRDIFVSAKNARAVRPNDTIVLPATAGGWNYFGHIPTPPDEPPVRQHGDGVTIEESQYRELARIDKADVAFQQSRAKIILRVHQRLVTNAADAAVYARLKKYCDADSAAKWDRTDLLPEEDVEQHGDEDSHSMTARCQLFAALKSNTRPVRYHEGIALIGPRDKSLSRSLPRASFDDSFDEHNLNADKQLSLADHLQDVAEETRRLTEATALNKDLAESVICAAERHDLGKADPRFQALLLNSPLDLAHMQPKLWAKSACGPSVKQVTGATGNTHELPVGFRHEMLSVEFAGRIESGLDDDQTELMLHAIASHHGHARPLAPVVADESPPAVSLAKLDLGTSTAPISLSAEDRIAATSSHSLDSGIADRFWRLNRRFGWWGLAWLESSLRLADWVASADPQMHERRLSFESTTVQSTADESYAIECPGLDASNPLAFLAAIGLLRTLTNAILDQTVKMSWVRSGCWHPRILLPEAIEPSDVVSILHTALTDRQRDRHFVDLGKDITVTKEEFRNALLSSLNSASQVDRDSLDFYTAFGSDGLVSPNDEVTIQDTALRTMAGAGHQHFLETMRNVIEFCQPDHLDKTIFQRWKYDDPTQTLSLRFDPLDDNRYALRWRNPSGDPDRRKSGSMLGANRLAIEAIPLFATVPGERHLQTTAFTGTRSSDTYFTWPVWTTPITLDVVRSVLTLAPSHSNVFRGIPLHFRSQRITVGKVRNFTPANQVRPNRKNASV